MAVEPGRAVGGAAIVPRLGGRARRSRRARRLSPRGLWSGGISPTATRRFAGTCPRPSSCAFVRAAVEAADPDGGRGSCVRRNPPAATTSCWSQSATRAGRAQVSQAAGNTPHRSSRRLPGPVPPLARRRPGGRDGGDPRLRPDLPRRGARADGGPWRVVRGHRSSLPAALRSRRRRGRHDPAVRAQRPADARQARSGNRRARCTGSGASRHRAARESPTWAGPSICMPT